MAWPIFLQVLRTKEESWNDLEKYCREHCISLDSIDHHVWLGELRSIAKGTSGAALNLPVNLTNSVKVLNFSVRCNEGD